MDARTTKTEPAGGESLDLAWTVHDPDALARNVARFLEEAGKAAAAYLKPREEGRAGIDYAGPVADAVKTIGEVVEYWLADPQRTLVAERRLWAAYLDLWTSSLKRMAGEPARPAAEPDPRDRRFLDPDWSRNQFFDFLKQIYLITSRWASQMVDEADGLDPHTREKAAFYVKQIASALAPSNFVLTNPELLRQTLASDGENLVRGMHLLAEDIKAGDGDLRLRQSSNEGFKLGETLAVTPGKVIYQNTLCQVIQYTPTTKKVLKRPLLIVPPWINKFYILDLTPEKSFIRWCVDQGHTVFVISWVNPDRRQAKKSFEHYMQEGVLQAVDVAQKVTGADGVNAVGYCVGGTLLAVALAWLAQRGDERIRSATLFATQVDFTYAGDLKVFVDEEQISRVEKEMTVRGYLEGKEMAAAFNMLRPNDLIWPYVIGNYFQGKRPGAFDLLYWNSDATRMPAANHSFYLRNCYLDNTLARGEMVIAGERLRLKDVKVPIYNLATREDHIAPARSVYYGSSFFGGEVTFVVTGSGHIAGVINPPSRNKYQYWTGPAPKGDDLEKWMTAAAEHPGSWWPHWQAWIEAHDDRRAKPPKIGGGKFKPIEDAPGGYVKVRA
ncbi:MAG TPA: class I poly(R)-hydroxyalkanoic acid synthase [Bauldia sp.]|nr:class I poly(R)-hydroxyalkanoic acid synthase [Bauldia sp.]